MIVVSLVNLGITAHRLVNQKEVEPVDVTYDVIQMLTLVRQTLRIVITTATPCFVKTLIIVLSKYQEIIEH